MKIKALKSFCGTVTMGIGDIKDVEEKMALGLIGAGYAQSTEEKAPPKKAEEPNEEPTPEGAAAETDTAGQQGESAKKSSKRSKE